MDAGGPAGGIIWLFDLIERARPELSADVRHHYNVSIHDFGHSVSYREAVDIVGMLRKNPATWIHALEEGWQYPVSFDWIVLKHTFDLIAAANSEGTPEPYPAPWDNAHRPKTLSREQVEEQLRKMNPERQRNG